MNSPVGTGLPASSHRFRQDHASRVDSLEYSLDVDSPGDLSDEDWGQPLGSQLLVDTEEVNLHHLLLLVVHPDVGGDCGDETDQLVAFTDSDATVPFLKEPWRFEGPGQELRAVVKPEHVVIVLHVVLVQQDVELLQHQRILQLECVPLETLGQTEPLLPHLLKGHVWTDALVAGDHLVNGRDGLGRPELVGLLGRLLLTLGRTWRILAVLVKQ